MPDETPVKPKCECSVCQQMAEGATEEEALQSRAIWEAQMMATAGWFIHCVGDDAVLPMNAHTHGLGESFNHLDLQLTAKLPAELVQVLFNILVGRIMRGEKFKPGDLISEVLEDYKVLAVAAKEDVREVLRIILPDKEGNLEQGKITGVYAAQYADMQPVEVTDASGTSEPDAPAG